MSQEELIRLRKMERWAHLPARSTDLSDEQIDEIFHAEYFERPQIEKLANIPGLAEASPKLAEQVFDAGILHGIEDPGRWLQQALDEELGTDLRTKGPDDQRGYDGVVGSDTRQAIAHAVREGKIKAVNNRVVQKRMEHMRAQETFDQNGGWLPRARSFLMR